MAPRAVPARRPVLRAAHVAGLIATLGLIGCATPPGADVAVPVISGRLSLQVDATAERPEQKLSAAFDLRGTAEQGQLQLNTPLGTTLANAQWSGAQARLVMPGGERRFADLDALSREVLGESLPLRALPDWLQGRPWPGAGSRPLPDGHVGFEQLDWRIDLARFGEGWVLASKPAPNAVALRVRLDAAP